MTRAKVARGTMRVRAYPILADAVERGIAIGWARAAKRDVTADEDSVRELVYHAILSEICETFEFPEDDP